MHIEFRISEKDYWAAAMLAMRKHSRWSSLEYYGPYIFGVIWIAAAVIPSPLNGYSKDQLDSFMTFGVIPLVIGFVAMRRKGVKQEYAKLKNFQLLQVLDLDATGLRLVTTAGTTRSAWQIYSKFAEDSKTFVVYYQGSRKFFPIPKAELTLAEIDELHALLVGRLPGTE